MFLIYSTNKQKFKTFILNLQKHFIFFNAELTSIFDFESPVSGFVR